MKMNDAEDLPNKAQLPPDDVPDHGTSYYMAHWGAYKGHIRGLIRGLVMGGALGLFIGLGFLGLAAVVPALGALGFGWPIVASLTAMGSFLGSEIMAHIGNTAGNIASHKALEELKTRYPSLPEISPNSPEPGYGHHYEVPADRDRGKLFHWRVGLGGALLGGLVGGLLGVGGVAEHLLGHGGIEALGHGMHLSGEALHSALGFAIPAAAGATYGASFGIERSLYKSIFNFTDNLFMGRLGGPSEAQLAKSRQRYREENPSEEPSVISSLQRQEEFYRLQDGYYKETFMAGFSGNARGMLGGIIAGGLAGLVLGGLLASGLGLVGIAGTAALGAIVSVSTALGASMGFRHFSAAAYEAASHSAADEIFEERMHAIKNGHEISFKEADAIATAKRRGDPNLTPPEAEQSNWLNWKMLIIGGLCGALAGVIMSPLAGIALAPLLAFKGATVGTGVCAAIFGLWGASFGLGERVIKGLQGFADNIFSGTIFPKEQSHSENRNPNIPLIEPSSPLAKEAAAHAMTAEVQPPAHQAPQSPVHEQPGAAQEHFVPTALTTRQPTHAPVYHHEVPTAPVAEYREMQNQSMHMTQPHPPVPQMRVGERMTAPAPVTYGPREMQAPQQDNNRQMQAEQAVEDRNEYLRNLVDQRRDRAGRMFREQIVKPSMELDGTQVR